MVVRGLALRRRAPDPRGPAAGPEHGTANAASGIRGAERAEPARSTRGPGRASRLHGGAGGSVGAVSALGGRPGGGGGRAARRRTAGPLAGAVAAPQESPVHGGGGAAAGDGAGAAGPFPTTGRGRARGGRAHPARAAQPRLRILPPGRRLLPSLHLHLPHLPRHLRPLYRRLRLLPRGHPPAGSGSAEFTRADAAAAARAGAPPLLPQHGRAPPSQHPDRGLRDPHRGARDRATSADVVARAGPRPQRRRSIIFRTRQHEPTSATAVAGARALRGSALVRALLALLPLAQRADGIAGTVLYRGATLLLPGPRIAAPIPPRLPLRRPDGLSPLPSRSRTPGPRRDAARGPTMARHDRRLRHPATPFPFPFSGRPTRPGHRVRTDDTPARPRRRPAESTPVRAAGLANARRGRAPAHPAGPPPPRPRAPPHLGSAGGRRARRRARRPRRRVVGRRRRSGPRALCCRGAGGG